jgi:hypothetical protein
MSHLWKTNSGRCAMGDGCSTPPDEEGVYEMMMKNFLRHYNSTRAPFGLYYHARWFNVPHHRKGFMRFLDKLITMDDVFFTTKWQLIQWMRHPQPLSKINSFEPWKCDRDWNTPGPCHKPTVCKVPYKGGYRLIKTCQPCPQRYPWLGNMGQLPEDSKSIVSKFIQFLFGSYSFRA